MEHTDSKARAEISHSGGTLYEARSFENPCSQQSPFMPARGIADRDCFSAILPDGVPPSPSHT